MPRLNNIHQIKDNKNNISNFVFKCCSVTDFFFFLKKANLNGEVSFGLFSTKKITLKKDALRNIYHW